jgi:hypothetical protein
MPLKPGILPPLPNLLQKHPPAPLRERILTNSRRALDGAFRVRQRCRCRRGSAECEVLGFCRVVLAAHEIELLRAGAVAGRRGGRAMDVGAAGREWRGNLGQELEGLVVVVLGLLRLVVVEW